METHTSPQKHTYTCENANFKHILILLKFYFN